MRQRIKSRVNIDEVVKQIEVEIKSYSKAIKAVMTLHEVTYNEAKLILKRKITERTLFKSAYL